MDAYETEMEIMKNVNYLKSTSDRNNLLRRMEDLDAFKGYKSNSTCLLTSGFLTHMSYMWADAEAQDMPSAERLEQISRVD